MTDLKYRIRHRIGAGSNVYCAPEIFEFLRTVAQLWRQHQHYANGSAKCGVSTNFKVQKRDIGLGVRSTTGGWQSETDLAAQWDVEHDSDRADVKRRNSYNTTTLRRYERDVNQYFALKFAPWVSKYSRVLYKHGPWPNWQETLDFQERQQTNSRKWPTIGIMKIWIRC